MIKIFIGKSFEQWEFYQLSYWLFESILTVTVLITVLAAVVAANSYTNYCSESLCDGKKHIACDNKGVFLSFIVLNS